MKCFFFSLVNCLAHQKNDYVNFGSEFNICLNTVQNIAQTSFFTSTKSMRLSFVQRLKNQKHQTVPTRESQQKSTSNSIRIKSHSLKHEKQNITEHCNDIKNLLSILEQTKNPQFQINTPKIYPKSKTQERKPFQNQWYLLREDWKENSVKLTRPRSGVHQVEQKQSFSGRNKEIDEKSFVDFQVKFHQDQHQQNLLSQNNRLILNSSKLLPYRFPGKKKLQGSIVLPPIGINGNKSTEPKIAPTSTKQQIPPEKPFIIHTFQTKRGLQNIGNTCYINSILQCLFHLPSFNNYFTNQKYLNEESHQKQKFNSDRSIVQKYRDLYLYVMKGDGEKKSTSSLKLALSKNCSLFIDWQQEDAHEFMRKLLDFMHQEINRSTLPSPYKLLKTRTKLQYSSISSLADEYFQYFKQKDDSYIYDCFEGQLYNNIECVNCHSQSISFENCLDICLPLVKGKDTLEELLGEFFGREKLGDFYSCEYCGKISKNSIKTTKFWPKKITVWQKKSITYNFSYISFESLNLHKHLKQLFFYITDDKVSQKYSNYTLKSVVNHRGAADGGHYWSVVKECGQWWEIDDDKVAKMNGTEIKRKFQVEGSMDAYILFYESMSR